MVRPCPTCKVPWAKTAVRPVRLCRKAQEEKPKRRCDQRPQIGNSKTRGIAARRLILRPFSTKGQAKVARDLSIAGCWKKQVIRGQESSDMQAPSPWQNVLHKIQQLLDCQVWLDDSNRQSHISFETCPRRCGTGTVAANLQPGQRQRLSGRSEKFSHYGSNRGGQRNPATLQAENDIGFLTWIGVPRLASHPACIFLYVYASPPP